MLCKTSPSRFKTVPEHHKTQEELDVETFPEFTSPVGTELIDKEEIKKIEKKVRSTLTNRTLSPC
jgi:predicted class III extradiol MEMO1 family dioxygenase